MNHKLYQLVLLMALDQYMAILFGTWWYWVSIGRYWSVLGGTGSVQAVPSWYLVVLGQYKAVLVGFCWYRLLLEDLQIFVGRFVDICWKICRFLLVHSIVGRFVDICWKICRFLLVQFLLLEDLQISVYTVILLGDFQISVGTFYCWKICRYLLGDLIVT